MPLRIRKSIGGKFARINLSNSGLSTSVGASGARYTTRPGGCLITSFFYWLFVGPLLIIKWLAVGIYRLVCWTLTGARRVVFLVIYSILAIIFLVVTAVSVFTTAP